MAGNGDNRNIKIPFQNYRPLSFLLKICGLMPYISAEINVTLPFEVIHQCLRKCLAKKSSDIDVEIIHPFGAMY